MSHTIFADGIGEISVSGGVVRIELVTSIKRSTKETERRSAGMIAVPIEGFANLVPPLQQVLQKMVDEGVVKALKTIPGAPPPSNSPNFQ